MKQKLEILYEHPAKEWEETFPIGNGSLGAMNFGEAFEEIIGLNDEAIWSGYPRDKDNPGAKKALEKAKGLILAGKRKEAQRLIETEVEGDYTESYLPLGLLKLNLLGVSKELINYKRCLDLNHSVSSVRFATKAGTITKKYFASYPHQAIYGKIFSQDTTFSLEVEFISELQHQVFSNNEGFSITGQCPEHVEPSYVDCKEPIVQGTKGINFGYNFKIFKTDGEVLWKNQQLLVENATYIEWLFCRKEENPVEDFEAAEEKHIEDYQALFDKVDLYLGEQKPLPMDQRLANLKAGIKDNGLIALYFQFGRYLMISSSRKGGFPTNLQGIWNWHFRAPWSSNYTTNINAEMNYWPVDSCNLSECFSPYEDFIKNISIEGEKTAQAYYGLPGSVMHHNSDRWYATNPVGRKYGASEGNLNSAMWAYWPMGGVWYANDLFRHYEYSCDLDYLEKTVYPVLLNSVKFLCGFMTQVGDTYHTIPSTSPENSFRDLNGDVVSVDKSSTMDISLITENFLFFKETCSLLKIKSEYLEKVEAIQSNLASVKIGSKGQVLEYQEEFEEVEPGHRHFSLLYGLYPGELFTGKMRQASEITIARRMEHGGGHTGWSNAWLINLYAILGNKEDCYQRIVKAITEDSYPNLWGKHPPFQIDSNFGVTAGIANLFVQDRNGQVTFLPALPDEFEEGYVKGLRIKGNQEVAFSWKNKNISNLSIKKINE